MGAFLGKTSSVTKAKNNEDDEKLTAPIVSYEVTPDKILDPRSPNPYRTPINDLPSNVTKQLFKAQDLTNDDNISTVTTVTPTKLKNKLLHDLGYTLDPRSPAQHFDRTPIIFNDTNISDDYSFASLSLTEAQVEAPKKENLMEDFCTPVLTNEKCANSEIDPRSPSIDIERTPLPLNVLLEDTEKEALSQSDAEEEEEAEIPNNEKIDSNVATEVVSNAANEVAKNMIYVDEDQEQPTTPTVKSENLDKVFKNRTPLSCLMNAQGVEKRTKIQNRTNLARSIFKESANYNSASKIPVFRKSISKESN